MSRDRNYLAVLSAGAVVVAAVLTGCSQPSSERTGDSGMDRANHRADDHADDHGHASSGDAAFVPPQWDDESEAAAIEAAENLLATFAQPTLPYEQWWAAFEPLLTAEAALTYTYVDPANIQPAEITGTGTLTSDPESTAYLAEVSVPTTDGDWLISLSRADGEAEWLGLHLTPPVEAD